MPHGLSLRSLSILSDKLLISRRENNTLNTKQFEEGVGEERVEVAAASLSLSFFLSFFLRLNNSGVEI